METATGDEVTQVVAKMGKSLKNVVNPDDVIQEFGADTFRLYEMFMAPPADARVGDTNGIQGCSRFLERLWRLYVDAGSDDPLRSELRKETPGECRSAETLALERALNRMLERVENSFDGFNFTVPALPVASCSNPPPARSKFTAPM